MWDQDGVSVLCGSVVPWERLHGDLTAKRAAEGAEAGEAPFTQHWHASRKTMARRWTEQHLPPRWT